VAEYVAGKFVQRPCPEHWFAHAASATRTPAKAINATTATAFIFLNLFYSFNLSILINTE
jgi:hypothetical protein